MIGSVILWYELYMSVLKDMVFRINLYVDLTVTVSPTAQQSPAVTPTKRESQRAQLQRYFLECLS